MPSTRDLAALPDIDDLRRLSQSLALLDAILCPDWEFRYHSFDARWNDGEMMASLRDGSGDGYFLLFTGAGAILKGFAHESPRWRQALRLGQQPPPGVFEGVPAEFASFLAEPAFTIEDSTFCVWRRPGDAGWQTGTLAKPAGRGRDLDPDGSAELLGRLDGDPETYRAWAEDYFETDVPRAAIDPVFAHQKLTAKIVRALNPELALSDLADDLAEIGYPAPGPSPS